MFSLRVLRATACVAALAVPFALHAEDAAKPAAAPAPAASEGFCGEPSGKPEDVIARIAGLQGFKKVDSSDQYLTFADDEKNPMTMYNVTTEKNPAHPAAVCRKFTKEGEQMTLKYNVVCGGPETACAKMTSDFNVLIARMQAAVNEQMGVEKK